MPLSWIGVPDSELGQSWDVEWGSVDVFSM